MLNSYKDGKFLIFKLKDGRSVKYDLSNGDCYGFSGKKVKDVRTQLSGYDVYDVIKSFEDEKYKKFLKFIYDNADTYMTNTGTFLLKVRMKKHLEQYFTAGLENVDKYLKYKISDVPTGLIKFCKTNKDILLDNKLVEIYINNPDRFNNIVGEKYKTLDVWDVVNIQKPNNCWQSRYFYELINEYKYNPVKLIKYADDLRYYEGIKAFKDLIREIADYAKMASQIGTKYDKYPKNFLTTHTITVRNYDRLAKTYNEDDFIARRNEDLEFKYKDYEIIYPLSTKQIKAEAINLNHCVAAYIQEVIDGKCHILFLRNKYAIDESLITLEVVDGKITHAAGLFNREPNKYEKEVIDKYNKRV